jgi:hypothetical protein
MTRDEAKESATLLWNQGHSLRQISIMVGYSHETVRQLLSEGRINTSARYPKHNPARYCRICGVMVPWPHRSLCVEHAKAVWRNNYKYGTEATREAHKTQVQRYREKQLALKSPP